MRWKKCNFDQNMTDREWYDYGQAHCGIEVGDSVKVLREAGNGERGWVCSWISGMELPLGKTLTVLENGGRKGFRLSNHWWYPFFVLELIQKKEAVSSLPQSIVDILDNDEFDCVRAPVKELVAEILKQTDKRYRHT